MSSILLGRRVSATFGLILAVQGATLTHHLQEVNNIIKICLESHFKTVQITKFIKAIINKSIIIKVLLFIKHLLKLDDRDSIDIFDEPSDFAR